MLPTPPTILAGRYRIEAPLGQGGMAITYLARDLVLDRPVAVKVMQRGTPDPADLARFQREARVAAAVSHPNVVQVYDAGQDGDIRFLVLEWVEGGDLAQFMRQNAPVPLDEAVRLVLDVLHGLAAIHQAGIVHRDVKPGNVLIDRQGRAKLTDFGIARRHDEPTLTSPVELLGTAPYVAPERIRGEPATPASDLYAVGVLLYELLTGRLPFPGQTPEELLAQHVHAPPIPPRRWRHDIPPALERVVLRALAKDPVARYRSAEAMAAALRSASTAEPRSPLPAVQATPAPDRPVLPRRSLAWAGGATVLSFAVVALLALLAWAQLASETDRAEPLPNPPSTPTAETAPTTNPRPSPSPLPSPTPTLSPTPTTAPTPEPLEMLVRSLTLVPTTPPELRRFADMPALEFGPGDLTGAYLPSRDGALPGFTRDLANAALLFPARTSRVSLVIPSGTERILIEVEGRQNRGTPRPLLQLALGGRTVWEKADPFPSASWSRQTIILQFDPLAADLPVTLELRNAHEPAAIGSEPWIAVRSLRVITAGAP
jgi:serine/threonine-protein kinase